MAEITITVSNRKSVRSKVYVDLYSAIFPQSAWNALRHGSHSFTCKLYHSRLYSPVAEHHRPLAGTHFTVPRRVEGWVDLSGWLHTEIKYSASFHFYSVMLCQNEITAVVCPSIRLSVYLEYASIVPYNTVDKHRSRKRRTIAQVLGTRVFMSTILSKFERGYSNGGGNWRWGVRIPFLVHPVYVVMLNLAITFFYVAWLVKN